MWRAGVESATMRLIDGSFHGRVQACLAICPIVPKTKTQSSIWKEPHPTMIVLLGLCSFILISRTPVKSTLPRPITHRKKNCNATALNPCMLIQQVYRSGRKNR
ncbi:hypothetical protein BDZ85DRAFT_103961 [Elsinoe ampelina]|uniref:Uncharacterized protein n=1 Tax=Elsinoe ampelina TaxID=302913 RepID=A0A6A6GFR4_9PEZI|nr:hypothetical protein BDZ85DRAFT_103961 [Elsinoe ampelina]